MKKTTLGLLTVLLGWYSVSARQITPDEALSVASEFMSSSELNSANATNSVLRPMKAPGVAADAGVSPYYIFNCGENEGFVIISGDDRAPKILGYSDKGSFDADNLPPQLKDLMELWTTGMSQLSTIELQHPSWGKKSKATRAGNEILLETAEWGQGYPYNAYCPVIEGEQAPAGCVATAMAIAMKYHNWPDYTRGDVQTDFYHPELSFDFSNYSIDWNVLDDKNNPKFADEVAKLFFGAGVCSSMSYGAYESFAEVWPISHKMIELYTYAKGAQFVAKEKYSDAEWDALLKKQLEEVGPVIYMGNGSGSHCFIVDGYDSDGLFHLNWGWDGLLNGYFALDFSEVGDNFFPYNQAMIIDLRPDKERKVYSKAFIPNILQYQSQEWNFFEPDIRQGERNIVLIPTITENCFNGYYGLAVVDEDDNIKEVFYKSPVCAGIRYSCAYPGVMLGNACQGDNGIIFPKLNEGDRYQLVSMDATYDTNGEENQGYWTWTPSRPSDNPEDWKIVLGGIDYPSYFNATGNRSFVSEVTLHVDEDLPVYMEAYKSYPSSESETFRQLKGEGFSENYYVPKKGVSFKVEGRNKDGSSNEVLTSDSDYDGTTNVYSLALTMNMDYFDVYIYYDKDLDTRKDSRYNPEDIVTDNGIVYLIDGTGASIIGYDNIAESVKIPTQIETPKGSVAVTAIVGDAFLHAPVKHLSFDRGNLFFYELACAGMDKLESISIESDDFHPSFRWGLPFVKSPYKYIYSYICPDPWDIQYLLDIKSWTANWEFWNQSKPFDSAVSDFHDVKLYISNAINHPDNDFYYLTRLLEYLHEVRTVYHLEDIIASVTIPGIGESSTALSEIEKYEVPVTQMWTYALDRSNGLMKIGNVIPEVKISSVEVNGENVEEGVDGLYHYPKSVYDNLDVSIKCILNDVKEIEVSYSSYYNSGLKDVDLLSGVEIIGDPTEFSQVDVFNLQGIRILEKATQDDINNLPSGIYIIGNRKVVKR